MTHIFLILLLISSQAMPIFIWPTVLPETEINMNQSQQEPFLRLTLTLLNQTYCVGDQDLDRVDIKARLTFLNTGEKSVLLFKSKTPIILRIMVSKSYEEAVAKKFEQNTSISSYFGGSLDKFEKELDQSEPNPKWVVTLLPGEAYETTAIIWTFVLKDNTQTIGSYLKSGEHVLQAEISTWDFNESLFSRLQERWKDRGILWGKSIISEPIQFKIEAKRNVVICN